MEPRIRLNFHVVISRKPFVLKVTEVYLDRRFERTEQTQERRIESRKNLEATRQLHDCLSVSVLFCLFDCLGLGLGAEGPPTVVLSEK